MNHSRDFSRKTLAALDRKGISVVGQQYLPNLAAAMPFASGQNGFLINDNGTGRVLRHSEVLKLAEAAR